MRQALRLVREEQGPDAVDPLESARQRRHRDHRGGRTTIPCSRATCWAAPQDCNAGRLQPGAAGVAAGSRRRWIGDAARAAGAAIAKLQLPALHLQTLQLRSRSAADTATPAVAAPRSAGSSARSRSCGRSSSARSRASRCATSRRATPIRRACCAVSARMGLDAELAMSVARRAGPAPGSRARRARPDRAPRRAAAARRTRR